MPSLRIYFLTFILTLLATLPATAASPASSTADVSTLKKMTWKIGDVTREALVYIPPHPEKNPPLIFAFHGHGGTSLFAARKFNFHKLWPEAIVVYPQGLPTPSPQVDPTGKFPGWQKAIGAEGDRDLKFFDAMLKTMKDDYHVDDHRIYCAGHSNGGFFTYLLWAARGDVFAAIAPIAAIIDVRDIKKLKPMPILHVAGKSDPLVKFDYQQRSIDADRKIDGCDPNGKPAGKYCTEYTSKDGPPVIAFIHPGGHAVPEEAPARIIEFFKSIHPPKSPH